MYILAVTGKEKEGAYAVDENDKRKVYMFLDKDDAVPMAFWKHYPDMSVVEVDDLRSYSFCVKHGHDFVTPDDIAAP